MTCSDPPSGARIPSRLSSVLVFPAPFRPSRPNISPCLTSKLIPSTATRSPWVLQKSLTLITASYTNLSSLPVFSPCRITEGFLRAKSRRPASAAITERIRIRFAQYARASKVVAFPAAARPLRPQVVSICRREARSPKNDLARALPPACHPPHDFAYRNALS